MHLSCLAFGNVEVWQRTQCVLSYENVIPPNSSDLKLFAIFPKQLKRGRWKVKTEVKVKKQCMSR